MIRVKKSVEESGGGGKRASKWLVGGWSSNSGGPKEKELSFNDNHCSQLNACDNYENSNHKIYD